MTPKNMTPKNTPKNMTPKNMTPIKSTVSKCKEVLQVQNSRAGMPQFNKTTSDLPHVFNSKNKKASDEVNDEPNYLGLDLTPRIQTPEQPVKHKSGRPKGIWKPCLSLSKGSKNMTPKNMTPKNMTPIKSTVSKCKEVLQVQNSRAGMSQFNKKAEKEKEEKRRNHKKEEETLRIQTRIAKIRVQINMKKDDLDEAVKVQ